MNLNINESGLNTSQNKNMYNNLKVNQNKNKTDEFFLKIESQNFRVSEVISTKNDESITQTSGQGDIVTLSEEGSMRSEEKLPLEENIQSPPPSRGNNLVIKDFFIRIYKINREFIRRLNKSLRFTIKSYV